jgi:hypothetical protein
MNDEYFIIPDARVLETRDGATIIKSSISDKELWIMTKAILPGSPVASVNDAEGEMWVTLEFARFRKWLKS